MNKPTNPITYLHQLDRDGATKIGSILVQHNKLTAEDVERTVMRQQEQKIRFGEAAEQLGLVNRTDVEQAVAEQFGYMGTQRDAMDYPTELVAVYRQFGPQLQALREVRTKLLLNWFHAERKALAICSGSLGEGVSFFAANLAILIAQAGRKTLLVDTNLHAPRQNDIFKLRTGSGLSNILAGHAGIEVIQEVSNFSNLSVLTSGTIPPNPEELLSGNVTAELHRTLCQRADVVLYDLPTFSVSSAALNVAALAAGVLLLVRKDHTKINHIRKIRTWLSDSGIPLAGSVLAHD